MNVPDVGSETDVLRPAWFCQELLAALDASDGRRKRRKRNTTPDAIGLSIKLELLQAAVREDPEPSEFEAWLFHRWLSAGTSKGAVRVMATDILEEWRLVQASESFKDWLDRGAPSDDAQRQPDP
jgi:hypothetical protein